MSEHTTSHTRAREAVPLWDVLVPAVLLIAAGGEAWRWQVFGRGMGMLHLFPIGFAVVVFFTMLALWAVGHMIRMPHMPHMPLWLRVLRVCSIVAAVEVVNTRTTELVVGEFAIPALVTLLLTLWMFRQAGRNRAVCLALAMYLGLTASRMVVEATLFTIAGSSAGS